MIKTLKSNIALLKDTRGVTAVEYAVIAGVMAVGVLAAFNAFSTKLSTFMNGLTL